MTRKKKIIVIVAAALIVAAVVSAPFVIREVSEWPFFRYLRLNALVDTIEKRQIYWEEGDDPMLIAYQSYFETDEAVARSEIRRAFVELLREDVENYYTLANLMLSHYDKYSKLVPQETYNRMYPENENYGGLGMVVSAFEPFVRVVNVYEDSASARAGVLPGDLIAFVNDTDIRPLTYDEASDLLAEVSADGGTVGVLREGERQLLTLTLSPAEVVIPNVDWRIDGDIAYLKVTLFAGGDFNDLVDAAFADFRAAGATRLVLDMRDNRGGTISLMSNLLDMLTPEDGVLMFTEDRRDKVLKYSSSGIGMAFDDIVVLADENTCSSAEVCAGYMKDRGYEVVGTLTYGKGTGLSILDFYGDVLVIATIDIILPETGHYNEIGIEPTIKVEKTYVAVDLPELLTFDTTKPISAASDREAIEALEERLALLGYLFAEPDGVWDEETAAAVESVAALADGDGASSETLALLAEMTDRLSNARYFVDTQLETAYELLGAAELPAA